MFVSDTNYQLSLFLDPDSATIVVYSIFISIYFIETIMIGRIITFMILCKIIDQI